MEGIWTWLKRANARTVLACALAGLGVVSAWWTWRLLTPEHVVAPVIAPAPAESGSSGLGLLDILSRQRVTFTNRVARNPFLLPEGATEPRAKSGGPKSGAVQAAPPIPAPPVKPAAPPPREPEVVILKYHGSMRRADGTMTALIEDSRSRRSRFYPVGTNVLGFRLEGVAPGEVTLSRGKEQPRVVKRGVPAAFTGETDHVE